MLGEHWHGTALTATLGERGTLTLTHTELWGLRHGSLTHTEVGELRHGSLSVEKDLGLEEPKDELEWWMESGDRVGRFGGCEFGGDGGGVDP